MISYGLTMQERSDEVPEEVAVWLLERNARYPKIEFQIGYSEPDPSKAPEYESAVRKYSRFYSISGLGVVTVTFPYLKQSWSIRIIGGLDSEGNVAETSANGGGPLPRQLRAEIAGLPSDTEVVNKESGWTVLGTLRDGMDTPLEKPRRLVPLPADGRWTSELSISGKELQDRVTEFGSLLKDPSTSEEATRLFYKKDWKALQRLKKRGQE